MRARREQQSASRISIDTFLYDLKRKIETPIAAHDERACHNGSYHNSRRIELAKHAKPQALKR